MDSISTRLRVSAMGSECIVFNQDKALCHPKLCSRVEDEETIKETPERRRKSPYRRLFRPYRIWVAPMKQLKEVMGKVVWSFIFFVLIASIAIGAPGIVQRLRHPGIVWIFLCPCQHFARQISRRDSHGKELFPLDASLRPLRFTQEGRRLGFQPLLGFLDDLGVILLLAEIDLFGNSSDVGTPPVIAIVIDLPEGRDSRIGAHDERAQPGKMQQRKDCGKMTLLFRLCG